MKAAMAALLTSHFSPPHLRHLSRTLSVSDLGTMSYADALSLQRRLAEDRLAGRLATDLLLMVEHPPVVTLGRGTREASLPLDPEGLRRRGIEVFEVERGGDVTYHGPGQLVGYPIFDLREHREDLHWYLRQLEEVLIRAMATFGIPAERHPGYTGVWTRGRKIASIGVHAKQWVTWHGFALNVTTELSPFDLIIPCGIPGVVMTSMARELDTQTPRRQDGQEPLGTAVREAVIRSFVDVFAFEGTEAAASR
jgi:lipoyl(octanoyl) transferase